MSRIKNIVAALAIVFAIVGLFVTLLPSWVSVEFKSVVTSGVSATANLGVYSDSACTQSLGSVGWGTISPGSSVARTFYVKNLGKFPVELSLAARNWSPVAANGPIFVGWNLEGAGLSAGQVVTATLTLSASSSASGFTAFSVDAVITGASLKHRV